MEPFLAFPLLAFHSLLPTPADHHQIAPNSRHNLTAKKTYVLMEERDDSPALRFLLGATLAQAVCPIIGLALPLPQEPPRLLYILRLYHHEALSLKGSHGFQ